MGRAGATQGASSAGYTGRLLAPDGRYEYLPLRTVEVDAGDVLAKGWADMSPESSPGRTPPGSPEPRRRSGTPSATTMTA
ncbi:hypothetical protein GCM10022214_01360 [Actinomadura miaoliensis]|uniref:Uncharacterized protein n=1 Tax=Actinomadura miaoliensis TaxID=430685 RepID=A0ABP7UW74_9ACTN